MFTTLLHLWTDLPAGLRMVVALVTLVLGGACFWYVDVRWGAVIFCLGIFMLLMGGKSRSEKGGYHF